MKMKRNLVFSVAAIAMAAVTGAVMAGNPARADSVEGFYKGKTIDLIMGVRTGGGYDSYGRLLARHLGRHIPGNPQIIAKNMPGGSGLIAANHLYNVAAKDGTAIGTFPRGIGVYPLLTGDDGVEFDARLFNWIGSLNNEVSICVTWHDSKVKKWADVHKTELVLGAAGTGTQDYMFPAALRSMLGVKLKIVSGYSGSSDLLLAMERGEVEGRCGWSWSSAKSRKGDWLRDGKVNILMQMAQQKHPELPDVPLITSFAENEEQKQILTLLTARQPMGRPFTAPPGVPEERVRALRAAFEAMVKDPQFLADAKKVKLEIGPVSGEAITKLLESVYGTPESVVAMARDAIKG